MRSIDFSCQIHAQSLTFPFLYAKFDGVNFRDNHPALFAGGQVGMGATVAEKKQLLCFLLTRMVKDVDTTTDCLSAFLMCQKQLSERREEEEKSIF